MLHVSGTPTGGDPLNFNKNFCTEKLEFLVSVVCLILRLNILIEHQFVTDW